MNIAIVIYSESGKSLKLAQLAADKLSAAGHQVSLTRLETSPVFDSKHNLPLDRIKFTNLPELGKSDAVIVGGPVWAFRLCLAVRKAVLDLDGQWQGKKVLPFVTHAFPWAWLTGTSSLNSLRQLLARQGANVLPGTVLSGSGKKDEARYQAAAEAISRALA